jgi:hypothetical protein
VKRLGPELRMSDLRSLKVPPVLRELYQDLRDRRLLPLVALILVAIVATPFLLGSGSDIKEPPIPPAGSSEASTPSSADDSLTVVQAEPGLRDYRRRLRHRRATNPFKPHYTGPVLAGTQLNGSPETASTATSSESSSSVTVESGTGSSSEPAGVAPPNGGGEGGEGGDSESGDATGAHQLTFFAFAIDVKITKTTTQPDGKKSQPEEIEKDRVLPPAALPGEKAQVVTYMGISPTTRKPLFLVSEEVESVFGETDCLAGSGRCQLIEVEPQMPVTFVYGENSVRYKLNVLKVEPVPTGHS